MVIETAVASLGFLAKATGSISGNNGGGAANDNSDLKASKSKAEAEIVHKDKDIQRLQTVSTV